MHPGPVNRGVELSADAIDSPQALITQQVESGVVVRMAVLFEVLSGGGGDGAGSDAAPHPIRERDPDPAGAPMGGAA
jgi:aspartate carbamoyltransferase catalytic subunit